MNHNKVTGNKGEDIAVEYLINHGFEIKQRNFLTRCGEIDIIAIKRGVIYFVEVKTRHNDKFGAPIESVNYYKKMRIVRAVWYYLLQNPYYRKFEKRLSVMGVSLEEGGAKIDFYENALEVNF